MSEYIDLGEDSTLFNNSFELLYILKNHSYFSHIVVVDKRNQNQHGLQIINKKEFPACETPNFLANLKFLASLSHPNIIKILDVYETDNRLFILTDHFQGQSLQQLINEKTIDSSWFTTHEIYKFLIIMIRILSYFSEKNFIHKNISPENIYLDNKSDLSTMKLVIYDFWNESRLNRVFQEENSSFQNLVYMAPEIFYHQATKNADIWSLGVLLYTFLSKGAHPFYEKTQNFFDYSSTIRSKTKLKYNQDFPEFAKSLINKMVHCDPTERYNLEQIKQHPYITRNPKQIVPLTNMEIWNVFNTQNTFKKIFMATKFLAYCWIQAGFKKTSNRYQKNIEKISDAYSFNKHKEDTHFTVEYINKLFGIDDKKTNQNEKKLPDIKPSFKDIFSQVIPKHLFQKPKRKSEIHDLQIHSKITTDNTQITNKNTTTENITSMTEIFKENNIFETPKPNYFQHSAQEITPFKKSFSTKKKKRKTLYQKATISFSAKIKTPIKSMQTLPSTSISIFSKPAFIIKTKKFNENDEFIRSPAPKALTIGPDKNILPVRNFIVKTKENGKTLERSNLRHSTENLRKSERSFTSLKVQNDISNLNQRTLSIEKTLPMPKVHLSTIFSLQLIPETQHKDLQKKIKDNPFMITHHQGFARKNTWQGRVTHSDKK